MKTEKENTFKLINPKCLPLTIEDVKATQGMENMTDDEAEEVVQSIRIFAKVLVSICGEKYNRNCENGSEFADE